MQILITIIHRIIASLNKCFLLKIQKKNIRDDADDKNDKKWRQEYITWYVIVLVKFWLYIR